MMILDEPEVTPTTAEDAKTGELDAEDLARILTAFRGQPVRSTPTMHYVHRSRDGLAPPYVFDEDSGMVYILD
ncbi:MAG: hypothetical protein ACHQQ3_12775 [Gemmatimonadales bacterium]